MTRTMGLAPDLATFERLAGTRFQLRLDAEARIEVELLEVRRGAATAGWEIFSLIFQAPAEAPAEQRLYEVEHHATGPFELFLVPVGRNEGGLLYEAVFNRRIEPTAGAD